MAFALIAIGLFTFLLSVTELIGRLFKKEDRE